MSPPRAAVVVAVRDAAATIRDCLDSLLRLDYPGDRLQLIVVDNGSRDATPAILRDYASRLEVLAEPRPGPAAARNRGIQHTDAEVVAFTDADCVVEPSWLARIVEPLADPRVGAAGGRNLCRAPAGSIARFGERVHDQRRAIEQCDPPYAITMNWASRREVLKRIGLFDPELLRGSDVDMALRLVEAGFHLVYQPDAVVRHRNRATLRALVRQGYVHGYHAHELHRRHAALLGAHRGSGRKPPSLARAVAPEGGAFVLWALVFEGAKRVGRLHGALSPRAGAPR